MDHTYQLLSGNVAIFLDGDVFFVTSPDIHLKYLAEIYSQQEYNKAFSAGMMTEEDAIELAVDTGEWSDEEEDLLTNKLPKNIDQMKLDYYNRFYVTSSKNKIKQQIEEISKKANSLYQKKMNYYDKTCEHIKNSYFKNYCLENCIIDKDKNKIDPNEFSINRISIEYDKRRVNSENIRETSKDGKWRLLYSASKENGTPFLNKDLNDDQLQLISWTKMYDSVHQSMDCPSDEIIKDDIAIDGWFLEQNKKREQEQLKEKAESKLSKTKGGGDLFLMAHNKEEVDNIISMNTPQGKQTLKSLANDLNNKGDLQESQLTHVKNNIQMAINSAKK
jgi:hypothetical protein